MSTTTAAIDVKQFLTTYLRQICDMYTGDLAHIPQDKLNQTPMGVARTPLDFTAECVGFNDYVAKVVRGDEINRRSPEEREAFVKSIDTFDKAKSALDASVDGLIAAINALDEQALGNEVATPWGSTMTTFGLAHTAGSHMSYHDGQLNYIQALYGDAETHWG